MGRRRNPIDIVQVKQDIGDGLLQLRYKNMRYPDKHTIVYLQDVQTEEIVKIGEIKEIK